MNLVAAFFASPAARITGLALVAALAAAGPVPAALTIQPPLFDAEYLALDTQPNPRLMTTGDLNADGVLDVVLAHSDGTVSVMLGDGAASVGTPLGPFPAGSAPNSVACADLNGDARLDLVVTSATPSGVSVLLGAGDGTLGPRTVVAADYPQGVAVGELTGDGIPDLAISDYSNSVTVLPGIGNGTFDPGTGYTVNQVPGAIALGDLNGDGRLDIVAACLVDGMSGVISVRLATASGGFGVSRDYGVGSVPTAVKIADLNHDGRPDLVVANYGLFSDYISNGGSVSVLLASGLPGRFGPRTDYLVGLLPLSVAVGDVNGDGATDVMAVDACCSVVSTLVGHGDGTFTPSVDAAVANGPFGVTISDLDGDPTPDAIVASGSGILSLLHGNGDGTFGSGRTFGAGSRPGIAAVADLDGDGKLDVVVPDHYPNSISVLLGNGDATFGPRTSFATATATPMIAVVGDLNGDGIADVVTGNAALNGLVNNVSVLLGTGAGAFAAHTDFATDTGDINTHAIALSDLDRDGKLDLVVGSFISTRNTLSVLMGNGDGTFGRRTDYVVGTLQASIAVGDLNGDGWPDLVVTHSPGNASVLIGNGDGTMATLVNLPVGGSVPTAVAMADVNGDGKRDLAVTLTGGGAVVLIGHGDGTFGAPTTYATTGYPYAIAIGDLNHDGIADLATADYGTDLVSVRLGDGTGGFGSRTAYGVGSGPISLAIGDMDRDGQADLVVTNTGSNTISVLLNRGLDLTAVTPQPESRQPSLEVCPTPTRDVARIAFRIPTTSRVRLTVLDLQGRMVERLADRDYTAGRHEVTWRAAHSMQRVAAGLLFVRIEVAGATRIRRLVLLQ